MFAITLYSRCSPFSAVTVYVTGVSKFWLLELFGEIEAYSQIEIVGVRELISHSPVLKLIMLES